MVKTAQKTETEKTKKSTVMRSKKRLKKKTSSDKQVIKKSKVKDTKVAKAVSAKKPKAEKKAKKETKSNRKINLKPTLSETAGLNISVAKVKNIISNISLNKDVHLAISEIRRAQPRTVKNDDNGTITETTVPGTPIAELSESTQAYIKHAFSEFDRAKREVFAKEKINAMPADQQEKGPGRRQGQWTRRQGGPW